MKSEGRSVVQTPIEIRDHSETEFASQDYRWHSPSLSVPYWLDSFR